jgi:hypothetical protein
MFYLFGFGQTVKFFGKIEFCLAKKDPVENSPISQTLDEPRLVDSAEKTKIKHSLQSISDKHLPHSPFRGQFF